MTDIAIKREPHDDVCLPIRVSGTQSPSRNHAHTVSPEHDRCLSLPRRSTRQLGESSQRSYIIDPYGYILAASPYWRNSVVTAEIDLDAPRIWFAQSDSPGTAGQKGYLAGYYPRVMPEKRSDFRSVLFAGRRPGLYQPIVERTLADRAIPEKTW